MEVRKVDTSSCHANKTDKEGYLMDMTTGKRLMRPYVVIGKGCVNCSSLFTHENFKIILQNLHETLISPEVGGVLDTDANEIIESANVCNVLGAQIDIEKVKQWVDRMKSMPNDASNPRERRVARVGELQNRMNVISDVIHLKDSVGEGVLIDGKNRLVINRSSRTYASLVAAPRNRFIAFIVLVIIFFTTKSFVFAESDEQGQVRRYARYRQDIKTDDETGRREMWRDEQDWRAREEEFNRQKKQYENEGIYRDEFGGTSEIYGEPPVFANMKQALHAAEPSPWL